MKISASIRSTYQDQLDLYNSLERRVKDIFSSNVNDSWFFVGRVKSLESFAQKLETGRFGPYAMEDFYACTIVVENRSAINEAIELVKRYCLINYKKPKSNQETHKYPDVFSFDDLRLYVKLIPSETMPDSPINKLLFEVQIKTFLQHAWAIATHDLVYKGDTISWSKARLAFQVKAMLEHAEVSIEQVESIAGSSALNLIDQKTAFLLEILDWLKSKWSKESWPKDLVRLSQTIASILSALNIPLHQLDEALSEDSKKGEGFQVMNLSPYEVIVKTLATKFNAEFSKFIRNAKHYSKLRLMVTPEMELNNLINDFNLNRYFYVSTKSILIDQELRFAVPPLIHEIRPFDSSSNLQVVS